ncbi:CsgG/HfaB family protein [Alcaligenes sp. RM2]|uniref:CsgG/HfaB family protein n=1 Tax=Alcaligenes TaxID=507 RepID=UPI00030ED88A|nr:MULTISPECIES: CsgG/HfaB family protein [Alcaligenes]URW84583.1 curli production assembly/transport protein CsgG [Alcaligenes sp. DN25]UTM01464.1 curli production assembly/transport protein CsgG [Alcaligenes sp. NLF5-7]WEA69422.1 CsgG/HfaB family protein [Alcaligenes faecalis]HRO18818.1 CsgG/HfaB family protein [Alcaligenes phenolicus]HRP14655.1 CsgG/HfaB family protein [Alcaligenes phenolicus]
MMSTVTVLNARPTRLLSVLALTWALAACAVPSTPAEVKGSAYLTPASPATHDLLELPAPAQRLTVAVYGFRDQTGQYKPNPDSSFSTSVTQGAAALLVKALRDSRWFTPVERESLQELLTERRIVRALDGSQENGQRTAINIPPLAPAEIMMDGGIISYESNVRTGGAGARFLGVGLSTQYRVDQVTVNLRAIDVRTGNILQSVSTTKTIFSYEVRPSVYKFVNFKDLLEIEAGVTNNEPAQLSVKEAIESAVVHLIVQGMKEGQWRLQNEADRNNPIVQNYMKQNETYRSMRTQTAVAAPEATQANEATSDEVQTAPVTGS